MKYPLVGLVMVIGIGCERSTPPSDDTPGTVGSNLATRHDPSSTGTVRGRVTWNGEVPTLPPLTAAVPTGSGYHWSEMPHPFAPQVDPKSKGLAGAVVFLRGVDPAAARPWDLPPVRVEMKDYRVQVQQGGPRRVGFVRTGDEVEAVSADPVHHALRARGAAFFTLPFPDPGQPLRRRFEKPGLVELTSGAGYYWAAADLFVCEHPYHALTEADGTFTLPAVPAGSYELVCWVRNWHAVGKDRDPETGLVFRQRYAPPLERASSLVVPVGGTVERSFALSVGDFTLPSQPLAPGGAAGHNNPRR